MFVYYGTDSKHIATEIIVVRCDQCNKTTPHEILVFQKYKHLYALPFFPASKETVSRCTICLTRLREYEMPPVIVSQSKEIRDKTRTRWWTFVGFLVVGALITIAVLNSSMKREESRLSIANCRGGEIYVMRTEYSDYTLVKVHRVNCDTVFLILNSHEIDKLEEVSRLLDKGTFNSEPFPVLKDELIKMAEDGSLSEFNSPFYPVSQSVKRNPEKE